MSDRQDRPHRKLYEKPQIRRIELKPEEALSIGCKTMGGNECNGGDCVTNATPCFVTYGS
jgi:hypothetical protein